MKPLLTLLLFVFSALQASSASQPDSIVFAIASDFHAPDVPEGERNLRAFVDAAINHNVDFMIELGDFCRLDSTNQRFIDIWNAFPGPSYHVIGNHDMDSYSPSQYVEGFSMPGRFYSFDHNGYHFIILDGNNLFDGKSYIHYSHANYYVDASMREYIDPEQLMWLRTDLDATDKPCIIFSHQSIDACLQNGDQVRRILEEANSRAGFRKVRIAFSGHNHSNYSTVINGITYVQINSASYVWIGRPTATERRYPAEINGRFPLLKYSMTFTGPLFAIVTLRHDGASIQGTEAEFMPPLPSEIGLTDSIGSFPLVPYIKSLELNFSE